jgi:molecular chaperone GrpE
MSTGSTSEQDQPADESMSSAADEVIPDATEPNDVQQFEEISITGEESESLVESDEVDNLTADGQDEMLQQTEPVDPEPATIEEIMAAMEEDVRQAQAEVSYRDADIVNLRRKQAQERSELLAYGGQNLARRVLNTLGDLDRAIANLPDASQADPLAEGVLMIRGSLWRALEGEGVALIPSQGEIFDPNLHEAISMIPASEEHPAGVIVDVLEEGYKLKERVLQPARVVVASESQ